MPYSIAFSNSILWKLKPTEKRKNPFVRLALTASSNNVGRSDMMSDAKKDDAMAKVIQISEARIRNHVGEMVRRTVLETLTAMFDAEADGSVKDLLHYPQQIGIFETTDYKTLL